MCEQNISVPGFLQQIRPHVSTYNGVVFAEADLDVFAEATTVVVSGGLGIAYRLAEMEDSVK